MRRFILVALVLSVFTLSSCLKGDDGYYEDTVAASLFLNALPGSDGLIVALDNNQLNNLAYGEYFQSGDVLPYRRIFPGNRIFRVFHPEDVNANVELARKELFFNTGDYYSVFLAGNSEADFEIFAIQDDIDSLDRDQALIRFIHLDAGGPALNFGIEGAESPIASAALFKSHTDFIEIAGDESYQFYIQAADGSEEAYEFEWQPKSGDVYTIWVNDLSSHGVIRH